MSLTQEEAERYFQLRKIPLKEAAVFFPEKGEKLEIELTSEDRKFSFQADVNRKGFKFEKLTYLNRFNKVYTLRRLDFIGPAHRNPPVNIDDPLLNKYINADLPCPHLHLFVEGFHDKWALPLEEVFTLNIKESEEPLKIMIRFFNYCNIQVPNIDNNLFSWKL